MMAGMTTKTFKHGRSGYVHHKCRCDVCSAANRQYKEEYYRANRAKVIAATRAYRLANPDQVAEYQKAYGASRKDEKAAYDGDYRDANRDRIAARRAASYLDNADANRRRSLMYASAHRQEKAAYDVRYRLSNPDKWGASDGRRRARVAENGVWEILPGEWERVVARYRGCCAYCGVEDGNLTMDHVVPVAKVAAIVSATLCLLASRVIHPRAASSCLSGSCGK